MQLILEKKLRATDKKEQFLFKRNQKQNTEVGKGAEPQR